MAIIDVNEVSKSYGDVQALGGVSFSIDGGEIYGLLGPNGAGKTTTIEILTGQTTPDSGSVSIAGVDPVESSVAARREMGILPEREAPPSFLTPREYFELVGDIRGIEQDVIDQRITSWSKQLSFEPQLDTAHIDLSRGQQQKVMITQALIHQPDVVVIDEPLVNLDPVSQETVKNILVEYASSDRVILLSTHDISVASEICTQVGVVQDSELAAERSISDDTGTESLLSVFDHDEASMNDIDAVVRGD